MASWVDLREPPESLLRLVSSDVRDDRYKAACDLRIYANVASIEALLFLLNDKDDHTRTSAISSLDRILAFEDLKQFKPLVGPIIAEHFSIPEDRHRVVWTIDTYLDNPDILERLLREVQIEVDRPDIGQYPYTFEKMLEAIGTLPKDDLEYAIRKLVTIGVFGPGFHPNVVSRALNFLFKHSRSHALMFAKLHLSGPTNGGFAISSYKSSRRTSWQNRSEIRKVSAEIVYLIGEKPENNDKFSHDLLDAVIALIILTKKQEPGIGLNYRQEDKNKAEDVLWYILPRNPAILSPKILGKFYKQLPQKMRERLESISPTTNTINTTIAKE